MLKITITDDYEPDFSLCGEPWTPPPPKTTYDRFCDALEHSEAMIRNNDCKPHVPIKEEGWFKRAIDWCLTPPEYDDGV